MQIFIGSDHAGFEGKKKVISVLKDLQKNDKKLNFIDLGTDSKIKKVDYPKYAKLVGNKVNKNKNNYGILICGTGTGMNIAANKINGIRAAMGYDLYSAKMSRIDNNANVLCLRSRDFNLNRYTNIIKTFLKTQFSGIERHQKRIDLIHKLEK
ncbi:ribose 5-phosphate isomerase B [Candidatus Woesearchaeota archaeon]|nr:ribose 5-phosphate isomerase B [Candidatus Woesearchaeota archaeon]MBT4387451.1 ribose 5-phosphate isomerase B [Candidatus Woesearchaeota archaeon]MBT4595828.1 ribose 5-phosphate isomerase B [Candidatus Woesearchaeota archaeon]MBT5741323.1 ribose 5-phosphate isomerase B [Candidatus Woesearchaeota archaeon]MBT6505591.1 ribose 5-phosphate isomerase B [Candidatus Woesearchaeota archaeon]